MIQQVPSWAIRVNKDDRISLRAIAVSTGLFTVFRIRHMDLEGRIMTSRYLVKHLDGTTIYEAIATLTEGWLISVSAISTYPGMRYGDSFARATLTRQEDGDDRPQIELLGGLITDVLSQSWPTMEPRAGGDFLPSPVIETPSDPGAGTNLSYTVPSLSLFDVSVVKFRFITSSAVANRQVVLRLNSGGVMCYEFVCATVQTASLTYDYVFSASGVVEVLTGTTVHCPIPIIPLWGAANIVTAITNIQAADDISLPRITGSMRFNI